VTLRNSLSTLSLGFNSQTWVKRLQG
jgi:hypothetical protein